MQAAGLEPVLGIVPRTLRSYDVCVNDIGVKCLIKYLRLIMLDFGKYHIDDERAIFIV